MSYYCSCLINVYVLNDFQEHIDDVNGSKYFIARLYINHLYNRLNLVLQHLYYVLTHTDCFKFSHDRMSSGNVILSNLSHLLILNITIRHTKLSLFSSHNSQCELLKLFGLKSYMFTLKIILISVIKLTPVSYTHLDVYKRQLQKP